MVSQDGVGCLTGGWLPERGPHLALCSSRGSPGVTTPHAWPSTSHLVSLGLGAPCTSQASLSWKPITDCTPIPVSLGGGGWVGSAEGKDTGENPVRAVFPGWFM